MSHTCLYNYGFMYSFPPLHVALFLLKVRTESGPFLAGEVLSFF